MAPFKPNGKPLHVHGFMKAFEKAAESNGSMLKALDQTGVPLIGIDPSMTLTYRQEYGYVIPDKDLPKVQLIQEWLVSQTDKMAAFNSNKLPSAEFKLLAHCTEKTSAAPSIRLWQDIYAAMGHKLSIEAVGCCGMSGTYGHETQNADTSREIYSLSWSEVINAPENKHKLVATGYSCRSQVKRIDEQSVPHPIQMLLAQLKEHN